MGIPIGEVYTQYSESTNELWLDLVNPYGSTSLFAIQIISPTFPTYEDEAEEEPDFELADFLTWARNLRDYLSDGEDSFIYPLYTALVSIAKQRIRWTFIQEELIWKQMISYYVAHYLELHFLIIKDEANRLSLSGYDKEKDYKYTIAVGNEVLDDFKQTMYGKMFWFIYKPYGQFIHWGVNY